MHVHRRYKKREKNGVTHGGRKEERKNQNILAHSVFMAGFLHRLKARLAYILQPFCLLLSSLLVITHSKIRIFISFFRQIFIIIFFFFFNSFISPFDSPLES